MPKTKTHSGAKKRFGLTGTGRIRRRHAFKNHLLDKKQTKQRKRLAHTTLVHQADEARVRKLLKI
ncbi:MAG: 50S ribosomal protein L35 [Bacteroidota bacterium]